MLRRRVYLLRHADVPYTDAAGRFVDPDTVSLTDQGREEACAVAESLRTIPLDRAVHSGLPRTEETARLVLAGRTLRPEVRDALQEIRPGRAGAVAPEKLLRDLRPARK